MSDVGPFPRPRATAFAAEQRALLAAFPAVTAPVPYRLGAARCVACKRVVWASALRGCRWSGPQPEVYVCPACREEERR